MARMEKERLGGKATPTERFASTNVVPYGGRGGGGGRDDDGSGDGKNSNPLDDSGTSNPIKCSVRIAFMVCYCKLAQRSKETLCSVL